MSGQIEIIFYDTNPEVVQALRDAFRFIESVRVFEGDILDKAIGLLVSPANSYGFMDGGIDKDYISYFGFNIQTRVQDAIQSRDEGHLPVGASLIVHTHNARIPKLIIAPTMVHPGPIPAFNVYRAFRAVLRIIEKYKFSEPAYCSGMGTGVGQVNPQEAAEMMAEAYRHFNSGIKKA